MRAAPGEIPKVMPTLEQAIKNIVYLMDKPRDRLKGQSISELVNVYSDGSPKWLTGSTVWLPSVFNQVDENTDLDIVFANKDSCERFVTGALVGLPGYRRANNTWGSGRIVHPDGTHVIDAWALEDDESIEELLLTYPNDYQRCAYFMTWSGSSPGYLTRIVKKRTRIRQTTGGYRRDRGPAPQATGLLGGLTPLPVAAPAAPPQTFNVTLQMPAPVQHVGYFGDITNVRVATTTGGVNNAWIVDLDNVLPEEP